MANNIRLPVELINLIAVHLRQTDWKDLHWGSIPDPVCGLGNLLACSLVCREWRAGVLPHLFHSVTYSFRRECNDPSVQPAIGSSRLRYKTVSMYCAILEGSPVIRNYTRCLRLVCSPDGWIPNVHVTPYHYSHIGPEHRVDFQLFNRLVCLLPRLNVLHLHGVLLRDFEDVPEVERRPLHVLEIKHSGVWDILLASPYDCGAHVLPLTFFSSIRHLHYTGAVMFSGTYPGLEPYIEFPSLRVTSLELEECAHASTPLVDALLRSHAVKTIRHLTTTNLHEESPSFFADGPSQQLQRLLVSIAPTLETVMVRRISYAQQKHAVVPHLSECAALRHLCIEFKVKPSAEDASHLVGTVAKLLRSIASAAPLARLDIHAVFPLSRPPMDLFGFIFRYLDSVLRLVIDAHDTLPYVDVHCFVPESGSRPGVPAYDPNVRSLFPQLGRRDELRFHSSGTKDWPLVAFGDHLD